MGEIRALRFLLGQGGEITRITVKGKEILLRKSGIELKESNSR